MELSTEEANKLKEAIKEIIKTIDFDRLEESSRKLLKEIEDYYMDINNTAKIIGKFYFLREGKIADYAEMKPGDIPLGLVSFKDNKWYPISPIAAIIREDEVIWLGDKIDDFFIKFFETTNFFDMLNAAALGATMLLQLKNIDEKKLDEVDRIEVYEENNLLKYRLFIGDELYYELVFPNITE